jgi:hypothetical protein
MPSPPAVYWFVDVGFLRRVWINLDLFRVGAGLLALAPSLWSPAGT